MKGKKMTSAPKTAMTSGPMGCGVSSTTPPSGEGVIPDGGRGAGQSSGKMAHCRNSGQKIEKMGYMPK